MTDKKEKKRWTRGEALTVMRACNCCNGVLLATFAVVAFLVPSGALPSFQTITVSGYLAFMGLAMCVLELNFSFLQRKLRRYFGFLFSFLGRSLFIFFAGSMALALALVGDGPGNGGGGLKLFTILGGVTCLNGLWNCVVLLCHPSFTKERGIDADLLLKDPYAQEKTKNGNGDGDERSGDGFDPATASGEAVLIAMLKSNPKLVDLAVEAATAGPGSSAPRQSRSRSFVAVINPFRNKTPRASTVTATAASASGPSAPASSVLDDDGDEDDGFGNSSRIAGEATVEGVAARAARVSRAGSADTGKRSSANPFSALVAGTSNAKGKDRKSGAAAAASVVVVPNPSTAAMSAARRAALVHQESSLPNVFAMEGSLDAKSYGDQRDSSSAADDAPQSPDATSLGNPASNLPGLSVNPFR